MNNGKVLKETIEKICNIKNSINDVVVDREQELDLLLCGVLSGEHCLLVGDFGTAKTMLTNMLVSSIEGAEKFFVLLNKFSTPEEVFGPINIPKLKEGLYCRNIKGKLPTVHIAYIDEIFKASTAILNTLLRVLNEREYEDDCGSIKCPLITCIASSNEWPDMADGKELGPLFDRFLIRKHVKTICKKESLSRIVFNRNRELKIQKKLGLSEIEKLNKATDLMTSYWDNKLKDAFEEIVISLYNEGVLVSNRRLFNSVKVVNAYALLQGNDEATVSDLIVLKDILWNNYKSDYEKTYKTVIRISSPWQSKMTDIETSIDSIEEEGKNITKGKDNTKVCIDLINKLKIIKEDLNKVEVPQKLIGTKEALSDRIKELIKNYYSLIIS